MAETGGEPSMEDILSSIKRIIADDTEAAAKPKRTVGPMVEPVAADEAEPEGDVLELTEAITTASPPPVREPEPAPAEPLISPSALDASRSRLAALSALVVKPEVTGSDTLEGLVREMLRPMLSEWLDAHLPDIVERLVALEVQRITARH